MRKVVVAVILSALLVSCAQPVSNESSVPAVESWQIRQITTDELNAKQPDGLAFHTLQEEYPPGVDEITIVVDNNTEFNLSRYSHFSYIIEKFDGESWVTVYPEQQSNGMMQATGVVHPPHRRSEFKVVLQVELDEGLYRIANHGTSGEYDYYLDSQYPKHSADRIFEYGIEFMVADGASAEPPPVELFGWEMPELEEWERHYDWDIEMIYRRQGFRDREIRHDGAGIYTVFYCTESYDEFYIDRFDMIGGTREPVHTLPVVRWSDSDMTYDDYMSVEREFVIEPPSAVWEAFIKPDNPSESPPFIGEYTAGEPWVRNTETGEEFRIANVVTFDCDSYGERLVYQMNYGTMIFHPATGEMVFCTDTFSWLADMGGELSYTLDSYEMVQTYLPTGEQRRIYFYDYGGVGEQWPEAVEIDPLSNHRCRIKFSVNIDGDRSSYRYFEFDFSDYSVTEIEEF